MTVSETMHHAQTIVAKEEARKNELRPYSQTLDLSSATTPTMQSHASPPRGMDQPLKVGDMDWEGSPDASKITMAPSKKRRGNDVESDTDTEIDDTDLTDMHTNYTTTTANTSHVPSLSCPDSSSAIDEFPPVFTSPQITQPELFAQQPTNALPARPSRPGRRLKGIPGRALGKTVSAPVGRLDGGAWNAGGHTGGSMDVDDQDGFDVSEWAASEEF